MLNRQWRLVSKPIGLVAAENLAFETHPVGKPGAGQVLIKLLSISLDPGQQVYMSSTQELAGGIVKVGDVVRAWAVGRVVESRSERFPIGSYVRDHFGNAGVQDYAILSEDVLVAVDPTLASLSAHLNVLGMPALTAYFGIFDIGRPVAGETVLVSGSSGAVGSVAGQIARIRGCRVIGIAGGAEKCRHVVDELGFDACIDYRTDDLSKRLAEICPDGINVYFDNVGGPILDPCLAHMAPGGRIVFSGAIADYVSEGAGQGLRNYLAVLSRGLRWQGLAVYNYASRYGTALEELSAWLNAGLLKHHEEVVIGLENFIPAFHRLFKGGHFGKLVLQVSADEGIGIQTTMVRAAPSPAMATLPGAVAPARPPQAKEEVFYMRQTKIVTETYWGQLGAGLLHPPDITLFDDPGLAGSAMFVFKLWDLRGAFVGYCAEQEVHKLDADRNTELVWVSTWTLTLPRRGTLFLEQIEQGLSVDIRTTPKVDSNTWSGAIGEQTTIGPRPDRRGRIVGGTGEFEGRVGSFIEIELVKSVNSDLSVNRDIDVELRLIYDD